VENALGRWPVAGAPAITNVFLKRSHDDRALQTGASSPGVMIDVAH
jgi:hypothetical protein